MSSQNKIINVFQDEFENSIILQNELDKHLYNKAKIHAISTKNSINSKLHDNE